MMDKTRSRPQVMDEYCLPGSRFERMLAMVERGACEEEFEDTFGKKNEDEVYPIIQKILNGTISCGSTDDGYSIVRKAAQAIEYVSAKQELQDRMYRMFDEGMTNKEVRLQTRATKGSIEYVRAKWAIARGIVRKKGGKGA